MVSTLALGGARRDEERSRAKERVFSLRNAHHRWDPKRQRPEPWRLYNGRKRRGESLRVFPLSNWTELDIWLYIHQERIPVVPLYFAAPRPVVERGGTLIMVDDERLPLAPGETPQIRNVRFRTLGCYPLTGAVESDAATVPEIIRETVESELLRASRPRHRSRRRRLDGAQEAGRLFLMNAQPKPGALRARCLPASAGSQEPAAFRRLRLGRPRQVDPDRAPAVRSQAAVRRPARCVASRIPANTARRARSSTSRSCSTGLPPSASRRSPSTSPIGSSPPSGGNSSSPTRPATSSTRATWRPAPRPPISR